MDEHPNIAVARRGYEAFASFDVPTLREIIAEDAAWHAPGNHQLSGDYKGRDAILEYFGRLAELTDGTFRVELHDLVGGDEHVVGLQRSTGARQGRALDTNEALVLHVRGGSVIEGWELYPDQAGVDRFWQ